VSSNPCGSNSVRPVDTSSRQPKRTRLHLRVQGMAAEQLSHAARAGAPITMPNGHLTNALGAPAKDVPASTNAPMPSLSHVAFLFPAFVARWSELPPSLSVCVAAAEELDRCAAVNLHFDSIAVNTSDRELLRDRTGKEFDEAISIGFLQLQILKDLPW
jgi:hypothetical protein